MYSYVQGPPKTARGLQWSMVGLVVYLLVLGVQSVLGVILLESLQTGGGTSGGLAENLGMFALGMLASLLSLVALVLYLVGFAFQYAGRDEFGPAHARNMRVALYAMIGAFVTMLTGYVLEMVIMFIGVFSGFGTVGAGGAANFIAFISQELLVAAISGVVTAALVAIVLVLSVRNLAKPAQQRVLLVAAVLTVVTAGIAGLVSLWQVYAAAAAFESGGSGSFSTNSGLSTLLGSVLGLAPCALYVLVYRGVGERLRKKELIPSVLPAVFVPRIPAPVVPGTAPSSPFLQPPGPQGPTP